MRWIEIELSYQNIIFFFSIWNKINMMLKVEYFGYSYLFIFPLNCLFEFSHFFSNTEKYPIFFIILSTWIHKYGFTFEYVIVHSIRCHSVTLIFSFLCTSCATIYALFYFLSLQFYSLIISVLKTMYAIADTVYNSVNNVHSMQYIFLFCIFHTQYLLILFTCALFHI